MKRIVLLITCCFALAACGGSSKTDKSDTEVAEQSLEESETTDGNDTDDMSHSGRMGKRHGDKHMGMQEVCPMHVEGTTMSLGKAEGGMAMTFTNAENVEEVQKRARMMAEHHPTAMEHHGSSMPAYTVSAENTETGAQLIMKPEDPEQLTALSTQMTEAINAQGDKQCPMMVMYDREPMHGPASGPASAPAEDDGAEAAE